MILALFTVDVGYHATADASWKKKRKHAGDLWQLH